MPATRTTSAPPGFSDPVIPPHGWAALWQTVTRVQRDKLDPAIAVRNTIGITLPIAVGVALGAVPTGLAVATGALNVAFTDSHVPYTQRLQRMLLASVMVGLAVFIGAAVGQNHTLAIVLSVAWAFAAGLMVALHTTAADVGVITLVTLLIYSASPMSEGRAALAGLLAFGGGILQTLLAVALWPIRRHAPERKALADLFLELARFAKSTAEATQSPPATLQTNAAREAIEAIASTHTIEAERYRMLLTQAERMRLSILALTRLRVRLRREDREGRSAETVDGYLKSVSEVLGEIASRLLINGGSPPEGMRMRPLHDCTEALRNSTGASSIAAATLEDARRQMDALNGQLRAALELARSATIRGELEFGRREKTRPMMLRLEGTVATVRANLSLQSAALRHAVRLAVCVGIGVGLGRILGWHRVYWLPMTVAIVLKPDFTATFSRGVLRLAGTFAGLILATVIFHILPFSGITQVALIALFSFALRWVGPANYGIFVTAVTGLVVVMIAMGGTTPKDAMIARGLNTAAGGVIALVAYTIWPTWERVQVPEALARMLDSYREYFRAIRDAYVNPDGDFSRSLDAARSRARLARTNLEASVDRLSVEPRVSRSAIAALNAILATSHRMVHALMALEAGLSMNERVPARPMFHTFSNQVELTLYYLAGALRGARISRADLPDLREAHHALVHSAYSPNERYTLTNVETDRMTNALNTLTEEIWEWIG